MEKNEVQYLKCYHFTHYNLFGNETNHYFVYYHAVPQTIFLSPFLVSDWLILCCENLILHQKKTRK